MTVDGREYVKDILKQIELIEKFASKANSISDFTKDEKTFYACVRCLEIIGEATKRISKDFRNKFPNVAWQEMAGMRDKLIHDYGGINQAVVWQTIKRDIPLLKNQLQEIVK